MLISQINSQIQTFFTFDFFRRNPKISPFLFGEENFGDIG